MQQNANSIHKSHYKFNLYYKAMFYYIYCLIEMLYFLSLVSIELKIIYALSCLQSKKSILFIGITIHYFLPNISPLLLYPHRGYRKCKPVLLS